MMEEMVKKVLIMLLGGGLVVGLSLPVLAVSSVEIHKLTASTAAAGDEFGISVALSGTTALVGAQGNEAAYLYDFSDPGNITEIKLTASDAAAGDNFGESVAISGSAALVSARYDNESSGSAYLFDVATGSQIAKLTASDAATYDYFGRSVALSGNTALVGANWDDDAGTSSGSAYLYDFSDPCNITEIKLTASDAFAQDQFGRSVAISGSAALVGAIGNDDDGSGSGSAYLYDFSDPGNITETKLTASDAASGDTFGRSVAFSGSAALVGARRTNTAGSAYLFDVATGSQIAKLTPSDGAFGDEFGHSSVAISGSAAIVGAGYNDAAGTNSGSAYLYDFSDPGNIIETKLTASDAADGDWFGRSVAISGNTALVGAPRDDDAGVNSGSAYLFCLFPPAGDLNDDCKVDVYDLGVLCEEWLFELISADVAPNGGDGVVNFLDWADFAAGWQVTNDYDGLADFAEQWLKTGASYLIADIAPTPAGDGIVNGLDYAALAEEWLGGL